MHIRTLFRRLRRFVRKLHRKNLLLPLLATLLLIGLVGYAGYMSNRRLSINPASYRPLLSLIGRAESGNNYNAYFGHAANQKIDFMNMSIAEVLEWQKHQLEKGSPSSAVGYYQIIDTTLAGLINELDLNTAQKFDKTTQDSLAIALLERRGTEKYINDELTNEELAASLSMEWAALPRTIGDNPEKSYYDGDGLNSSRVTVDEVQKAIASISVK